MEECQAVRDAVVHGWEEGDPGVAVREGAGKEGGAPMGPMKRQDYPECEVVGVA